MILQLLPGAILETLYMVVLSSLFAILIGLPLGVALYQLRPGGIAERPGIYRVLDAIVNITRSIPYIILMILLLPVTKVLIGTSIGSTAMLFSLTLAAAPFFARLVESALLEVDGGIIEAAKAMGSNQREIILKVLLPEALPSLVLAATNMIINLISYTAMAGTLGGGGLGAVAVRYGLYRYQFDVLIVNVAIIVLLVQLVQWLGTHLSQKLNKK
ncbi:MAG: ABC transporter permease [Peptoniphilaceae bacterium]|nr:ABC transporter permease [Peptoniphilaceae bacterium]MDY6085891.1 methionine ABC transporter permease [Peptoniphilaceae bacterium]